MIAIRIAVHGPPGEAEALFMSLQSAGREHDFEVKGQANEEGALSVLDTIVVVAQTATPIAALVWAIAAHKQNRDKVTSPAVGELHIHLHSGTRSLEITDADDATILEVERLCTEEDDDPTP
jgi:hypothetical protein